MRLTQSFTDAINEARRVFGCDDNSRTQICKRALRYYLTHKFEYSACKDKCFGNPVTIKGIETQLTSKEFQGLVIAYIQIQIEKNASRRQRPLELEQCENYIVEGANE